VVLQRTASFRFAFACGAFGLVLAVLGAALVASRSSSESDRLDRTLATTAGEKAALVATELERARALALVTARIPPFAEFYADSGSLAAKIAAVAGPRREINDALVYDWQLYPARFVEVGYVDRSGRENARVLRGLRIPAARLVRDVRDWPSFVQGVRTPVGKVLISSPFLSPTARVPVVAATTPVEVNGRLRAYVELELKMSAIQRVLGSDVERHVSIAVVDSSGARLTGVGKSFDSPRPQAGSGVLSVGNLRVAVRRVPESSLASDGWFIVTAARAPSTLAVAFSPAQGAVLALASLLLIAAFVGFRRTRAEAASELAAEQVARAKAEQRARVDALTGLFNRRHAMETVEHELARSGREGSGVGLLMFDIDKFKRINDEHGHAGGDIVLVEVARRLGASVREWDVVARMGGEEFCVIAPALASEDEVAELAERLRLAVSGRTISIANEVEVPVTISVGVAFLHGGDGSAEHAIECSDRALYAAKRRGRNRVRRFTLLDQGDMRAEQPESVHIAEALALASDLREGAAEQHSNEVARLSAAVARRMGLSEEDVLRARLGGLLHDVGKIAVPDSILTKPGPLTESEWEAMRRHPAVGDELLCNFPELAGACSAVRHHHERYDGTGYPDRLAGDRIPLEARIVAAADAYSAMTIPRPYQLLRTQHGAIVELRQNSGTQFDPAVVDALIDELASAVAYHDTAAA
jgi:diguanylate cyclase (GGDEF)-like protein/putative nucleotidyltransferase with HDIG domain